MSRTGTLLLIFALLIGVQKLAAQDVQVYQTTPDLTQALQPQAPMSFSSGTGSAPLTITVNDALTYQQMDGFGASLTDSSAWLIYNKLDATQRDELMQQLFDPAAGIGLSFLRQPMGASDFALNDYSYDDLPSGQTDPNLAKFSTGHDEAYIIPVLKQALAVSPHLKIMANPWSPPGWMKSSGSMIGGTLLSSSYAPLANYFVKFVQAYQAAGVPIYAISMQNEPLYIPNDYPGMGMPATEQATFVRDNLGPAFKAAGLSARIMVYDHNWDQPSYPSAVLSNAGAAAFAAGTAFHCYAGNAAAQTPIHDSHPEKDLWETECSGGTWQSGNILGQETESLIIGATRNWAKSVVLWNMALDQTNGPHTGGCATCRGVVTLNTSVSPSTVTPTVDYYVLGQASKFVVPGAYRIDSNSFGSGSVEDVAFRNPDGSVVLVTLNSGSSAVSFNAKWLGQYFTYTQPAGAVTTFVWPPSTPPAVALAASPSGLSVVAGAGATLDLTVQSLGGAAPQVSLSCGGAPSLATCTISPASISFAGPAAQTATVTVTTTASKTTAGPVTKPGARGPLAAAMLALLSLAALVGLASERKPRRAFEMPAFLILAGVLAGCGDSARTLPPAPHIQPGTPAGTYNLTITATPTSGAPTVITLPLKVS